MATDAGKLAALGIKRVVTALRDPLEPLPGIIYNHVPVVDNQEGDSVAAMAAHLPSAIEFISACFPR